ncbi:MAG TPA: wax ester/triacylglycerol synthase family O-acyltransferase [Saprospiraceae bacterium]|nr:wax ester/triacylglycerol synthase family O-acyltransferase [Saprospiraceae bacterium]HMQ85060.1 wax ester/triacylglycerol synthase family O-acyltransferase [Saprospiraceae bacterium]
MQQLSALDTWFLHLENNRMPMHVGSLFIFAPDAPEKAFDFDEFKSFMQQRLHLSPVFRRRMVEVPLNLGRPFWVEDPFFNLDNHMLHVALPKPASIRALVNLASQFYNPTMDRTRPMWKMVFITGLDDIEGLPPNAFAALMIAHHANIDGMSGAEIMATILDFSSQVSSIAPPKEAWNPKPLPSYRELIGKSYTGTTEAPGKIFNILKSTATNALEVAWESINSSLPTPPMVMTAPKTILNKPVTPDKTFGAVDIPLKEIKKIKDAVGCKVNDVVLAICGAALRKYLLEKEELPEKPLVAMAPISVRSEAENGTMGNRISGMLVALGTDIEDPYERLLKVYENTQGAKNFSKATPVDQIVELIPTEVGAMATRFYTQMGLSNLHRPFFNVIITNVPGPPIPLYMNGFRILNQYGLGVLFEGIGLMIVVFSYAGTLSICATSCGSIMPDIGHFAKMIREGLHELEARLEEVQREETFFKKLEEKHAAKG